MAEARRVRVAVDAMGGDFAPEEVVQGAAEAARDGVEVLLVGDPVAVQRDLERSSAPGLPLRLVPSEGVVREGEAPVQALRQKPRASILVATGLVKEGKADAVVSMGSTGAAMAAAAYILGLMDGIERPALGGPILGLAPQMTLIDLGSNVDCRPSQLLTFAVLGATFAQVYLGLASPRVALLSVGAEEGKGNRQTKEAYTLFRQSGLNFMGNVEGHDLPRGAADVVVCDGFVGNVVMKLLEGLGERLAQHLRGQLQGMLSSEAQETVARHVYELLNRAELSGGGPLFGVKGLAIVGHGRARAPAVANAIRTARYAVEVDLVGRMAAELATLRQRVAL